MTPSGTFQHEAVFYAGETGFLAGTVPFLLEAVWAGCPTLVVVSARKIDRLRSELGHDAGGIRFADMAEVGANPARIIPAWRDFVAAHAGSDRPLRGVGEPIYPERTPDELVECQRHEDLLNVAFDGTPAWRLLCPYDTTALDPGVIAEARRSHPLVDRAASADYRGLDQEAVPFDLPLPPPAGEWVELLFAAADLHELRAVVADHAARFGLDAGRAAGLVLAVNEIATNSVRHGGGKGVLRIWPDGGSLLCEIRDQGRLTDPLAGRVRPPEDSAGGWGIWLANQMCDLVQLRSFADGTVVRLHMRH